MTVRHLTKTVSRAIGCLSFALLLCATSAWAQYPSKPVRLLVPFPAGGATDSAARDLAEGLSRILKQTFLVENKPGADGAIAAQTLSASAADGYTLLFASSSMEGISFTQKNPPFGSLNDFTPVSLVCRLVFGVVVSPNVPSQSMRDFVAFAQSNPEKLFYGSGSLSELMAAAEFMAATRTRMVKVNYKGGAPIVPDLASDRIQVSFGPLSPMLPFVRDGRVKVLAVLSQGRVSAVPEVPTLGDVGISGVSGAGGLQAVVGPRGMSADVVQRLVPAINALMAESAVRNKFVQRGQEPETSSPEALASMIRAEREGWERFVAQEGIKPE